MDLFKGYEGQISLLEHEIYSSKKLTDEGRGKLYNRIFQILTDQLRILNLDENPNKQDEVEVCLSLGHVSIKLKDYPRAINHYK
jgi:hypothetical protein